MRNPTIKVSTIALIGLLSFSLTSCRTGSGNSGAQSSPAASASENGTQGSAQSEASQGSSPTTSTQSATANAEDRGVTPTLGTIPQGATRLEDAGDARGIWVNSPSGNIHCLFSSDLLQLCVVDSYRVDKPYGDAVLFPGSQPIAKDTIYFAGYFEDEEMPKIAARRDGPLPTNQGERLRTLAYGETVYAGNDVCASTSEAMVCWDTETGDGAKINRAGTEIFHLKK